MAWQNWATEVADGATSQVWEKGAWLFFSFDMGIEFRRSYDNRKSHIYAKYF